MRLSSTAGLSFCLQICSLQDIKCVDFRFSHFQRVLEVSNVIIQGSLYVNIFTTIAYYNIYHP